MCRRISSLPWPRSPTAACRMNRIAACILLLATRITNCIDPLFVSLEHGRLLFPMTWRHILLLPKSALNLPAPLHPDSIACAMPKAFWSILLAGMPACAAMPPHHLSSVEVPRNTCGQSHPVCNAHSIHCPKQKEWGTVTGIQTLVGYAPAGSHAAVAVLPHIVCAPHTLP